MSENAEPKRKRIYEGEALERRRAYQRVYGQKQRDKAKAEKGIIGKVERQAHQNFSFAPFGTLSEEKQALGRLLGQIMTASEIEAECAHDLQDGNASNYNFEYFKRFRKEV